MGSSKETENSQMRRHDQPDTRANDNDLVDSLQKGTHLSTLVDQVEKGVNADQKEDVPPMTCEKEPLPADGVQGVPDNGVHLLKSNFDKTLVALENEKENSHSDVDPSQLSNVSIASSQQTHSSLQGKASPVSISGTSGSEFSQSATAPKQESDDPQLRRSPPPESCKGGGTITVKPEAGSDTLPQIQIQSPNAAGLLTSQSNQVTLAYSVGSLDKLQPRRHPETFVQSTQGSSTPSYTITPEKPSVDGYNWRKYGQKFVKGNEFIRSYYKCTHPNCLAKKQVERSNTGPITDINYLGQHEHPLPQHIPPPQHNPPVLVQPLQVREPDTTPIITTLEANKPLPAHGETSQSESAEVTMPLTITASASVGGGVFTAREDVDNNTGPEAKRQKRESDICAQDDPMLMSKQGSDMRHVVQTMSEVDLVNDGYRWRKYGQKLVKGNPNPRSYYRCSNAGCPVKKHVERASHDRKLVITTYEGQHDHDLPASRTLTPNISSAMTGGESRSSETGETQSNNASRTLTPNTSSAMTGGESRSSETGETQPNNALSMVVHISAN